MYQPQAPELEAAILGACLIEKQALPLVADLLRPEMFYDNRYQVLYAALKSMYRAGKCIDILTVKEEVVARGELETIGGPYEIVRLSSLVASSAHIEYHAMIVRQKYLQREMMLGFSKLLALASDETIDIADTMVDAHQLLDRLEKEFGRLSHLRGMDQLMDDTLREAEARILKGKDGVTGIPTGLAELDRMTAGWQNGDLIVGAGRPGTGKTAIALHLARAAAQAGRHVVVYSLEMQGERLGDRWLVSASDGISATRWRSGQVKPAEMEQARQTAAELARLPIRVDDTPDMSLDKVRASARLLQSKGMCDFLIIDYLQLCDMRTDQKNRNREQEVAQASRKAKLLAKELNIPIILLSQLNREPDGRPYQRPELSHLRESGAIEQDADLVFLLYRPALAHLETDRESGYPTENLGVVIIAKHRNGQTGNVYFAHNESLTKICDYTPPFGWMDKRAK